MNLRHYMRLMECIEDATTAIERAELELNSKPDPPEKAVDLQRDAVRLLQCAKSAALDLEDS